MHANVLAERISDLIRPVLEQEDAELVDVVYLSEAGRWVLRVYVDKTDGVTVDDCAGISRRIGDVIEVEDLIPHGYRLEVSSPGLDRTLKTEEDFRRFTGRTVKVAMKEPQEGRKNFKGKIVGCIMGSFELEDADGARFRLPLSDLHRARLEIETTIGKQGPRPGSVPRKRRKP